MMFHFESHCEAKDAETETMPYHPSYSAVLQNNHPSSFLTPRSFFFFSLKASSPRSVLFFFCLPRSILLFKLDRFFSWMIFLRGPMTITSYSFLFISLIMECRKQRIPLISLVKKKKKLPNGTIFSIKFKLKSLI